LHPIGPKPHTQIAILSIYKQNQIDVIYYNSLAMGNIKSSLIPKEHLKSYLQEYSDISIPRSTANFQYFIESTVRLFSNLYTGEFLADLVDFITMLSKNIEFMVFQDLVIVSKLMTSFIILHQELDDRFETISEAMMKQKIRNCQVVCFAFMLLVAKRCLDILDEQLKQPEAIVTIECAVPVGNLCTFLQLRKSTIQQYTSYGSLLSEEFEKLLYGFARSLVVFVNCISAFADMDGSTEYCISDIHLIALKAFTPFFDDILNSNRTVVADLRLTQYARIGHFTQDCANDPEINFISFQKHESKFIVKDSMTKVF
jgi:hypothetical protein